MKITHRYTGITLYELEGDTIKELMVQAVKSDANLRGANLICANLRGANLRGANLRDADLICADLRGADLIGADLIGADLIGADLRGANLRGANLRGANLRDANLRGADLIGADLICADLRGADLIGADLIGANLRGADLRGADLRGANLRGANLRGANLPPAPRIENIDSKILQAIENGGTLNMATWHTCETTHCRAGWAIHLAGEAGKVLEYQVGAANAGVLIYMASRGSFPDFYATNEAALEDIKKCAARNFLEQEPEKFREYRCNSGACFV